MLTLIVAMGVGWWLDRSRIAIERDDAVAARAHVNERLRLIRTYRRWRYGPGLTEYLEQLAEPRTAPDDS